MRTCGTLHTLQSTAGRVQTRAARGFTLVEILIVAAIIGLMAAILFPVFARARAQARRTACTSNLRQVGLSIALYRQDANQLPSYLSQIHPLYLSSSALLRCPNDAQNGQYDGNDYVEGDKYLPSGVSYEYFPQWDLVQNGGLDWYQSAPDFGSGKWDDLTPLGGCAWHWATSFSAGSPSSDSRRAGWQLILTLGGSVRKIRSENPISQFTPEKYQ